MEIQTSAANTYGTGSPDVPADEDVQHYVESRLKEAAERITFHRTETERWERIARACGSALIQVQAVEPVPTAAPDHFFPPDQPQQSVVSR